MPAGATCASPTRSRDLPRDRPHRRRSPSSTSSTTTCRSVTASCARSSGGRRRSSAGRRASIPGIVLSTARAGRRRRVLPEADPERGAGLRGDRADPVPVRAARRRGLPDRARGRRAGRRRWGRSPSIPGPSGARTSTIPTSCGSTSTRSPGPTSPTPRGSRPRRAAARRTRLRRLPEDVGRPRRPHLRPDRAALDVHRRAPRRDRLRARARAAPARPGDDQVVEGGAGRADLHRLQPERARPHDRLAPTASGRSPAPRSRRRWPGTSSPTSRPRTSRSRRCPPVRRGR